MTDLPLIFLSYASPDRDRVMPWYTYLKGQGFNPWIDHDKLIGGQAWDFQIRKALNSAALIVLFISNNSVSRRGYVQREVKLALNKLEEKLANDIYIIPVLLDKDAGRPEVLSDLQFLDVDDPDFGKHLVRSIEHQLAESENASEIASQDATVVWSKTTISEERIGVPGYSFSAQIPNLSSKIYQNLEDCAEICRGWAKERLLDHREMFVHQGGYHDFGEDRFLRTNVWDSTCDDPIFHGQTVSIRYQNYWYGAGAAHGNFNFKTFVFFIEPFFLIRSVQNIFKDEEKVFPILKSILVEELCALSYSQEDGSDEPLLDRKWVTEGISCWDDLSEFVFTGRGVEFAFGSYQVGPYSTGVHYAAVPYEKIAHHLRPLYQSALGVRHIAAQDYAEIETSTATSCAHLLDDDPQKTTEA